MSSPVELSPKCQEHFKGRGLSKCGLNLANCSMSRAGFLFAADQFGQDKAPKSTVNLPALSWMHCPFPHFYYNFFSGVFLHLRFFFMASLILNAMRKIGALTMSGNELCLRLDTAAAPAPFSWIFLDFSQPSDCLHLNHRWGGGHCAALCECISLHSHSLLLPRGGRQINQWQRDFIVSLTEILPL